MNPKQELQCKWDCSDYCSKKTVEYDGCWELVGILLEGTLKPASVRVQYSLLFGNKSLSILRASTSQEMNGNVELVYRYFPKSNISAGT